MLEVRDNVSLLHISYINLKYPFYYLLIFRFIYVQSSLLIPLSLQNFFVCLTYQLLREVY